MPQQALKMHFLGSQDNDDRGCSFMTTEVINRRLSPLFELIV